jgi:hypothetical protein
LPVDEPLKKPIDTPFKTGGGGMVGVAFMIAAMAIILIALATWTYR